MKKKNHNIPSHLDAEGHELHFAKEAFERIKPSLALIPAERVERVRLDLQAVAIVVGRVSTLVDEPAVRRRFEELPRSVFDLERLDELRDLSLAAWYARTQALSEEAQSTEHRVSIELVERARELRERMIHVVEYHFRENASIMAELASIRVGSGYQALASDLTRLASLYEANAGVLEGDHAFYQEGDVALAQSYASRIIRELGRPSRLEWTEVLARLWTRLHAVYEDVRQAGAFLFRGEPLANEFPSLHAATRAKPHSLEEEEDELPPAPVVPAAAAGPAVPTAPPAPASPVTPAAPVNAPSAPAEPRDR